MKNPSPDADRGWPPVLRVPPAPPPPGSSKRDSKDERLALLREKTKDLSAAIEQSCEHSRERSLAITNLEQAIMWANAAIARYE